MAEAIRVNFGRPLPVFPLPESVLLPHEIQPLHVFEPRYQQLIRDCLDNNGQMAIATFTEEQWQSDSFGEPTLRPAVCVGQIVQHYALEDGRQDVLLQGICRAKILEMVEPENGGGYRCAKLAPLEPLNKQPPAMEDIRQQLRDMLGSPQLSRLRSVETVMEWFDRDDVSTHALLELIGFALLPGSELKYELLAEASPVRRATMIKDELIALEDLVGRAEKQRYDNWPRGMSWN